MSSPPDVRAAGRLGGLAYGRRLDGLRQRAADGDQEAREELERVRQRARENGRKRKKKKGE